MREGGGEQIRVNSLIEALGRQLNFAAIRATKTRKIGVTAAIRQLPTQEATLLSSQMRHSAQTELSHYRAIFGRNHAADTFKHMKQLRQGSQIENDNQPRVRTPFTDQETALIRSHFSTCIRKDKAPTLRECNDFVAQHGKHLNQRRTKDIQNKVRNLRKRSIYKYSSPLARLLS